MVSLSDPEVAAIPVNECGEELIDLRTINVLRLNARLTGTAAAHARLRIGVVDRLVIAQTLLPPGVKFLIIEGLRPFAAQKRSFDELVDRMRARQPGASEPELRRLASRFVSPPELAPHVTGAAADLTLCTVDGEELDASAGHHHTTMATALEAAGLVNYPNQQRHWSYGDRYWAYLTGARHAHYGPIDP